MRALPHSAGLRLALLLAVGAFACARDGLRGLPCTDRSECSDGMICAGGFCQGCTDSSACAAGESCDDGRCVACDGGSCTGTPPAPDAGSTPDAGPAPDAGTVPTCHTNSDCAGGGVCRGGTCGACVSSSECGEGTCEAGVCQICSGDLCPIDPTCDDADGGSGATVFEPRGDPLPQTVPANCLDGFEMNDLERGTYELQAKRAAGSRALVLEVDFATYRAPDSLVISGTSASGAHYEMLRTCHLKTASYGSPVRQGGRPPEDSIREFRVSLAAGTRAITFDFSGATSPNYLRVLGLCDFDLVAPTQDVYWREVTSR